MKKKRYKTFECGSYKFKITYKKRVINPDTGVEVLGLCIVTQNVVHISTNYNGEPLSEDAIEHNLFHELEHVKLILLNKWKLNADETFVDTMGMLNAQVFKTLK